MKYINKIKEYLFNKLITQKRYCIRAFFSKSKPLETSITSYSFLGYEWLSKREFDKMSAVTNQMYHIINGGYMSENFCKNIKKDIQ